MTTKGVVPLKRFIKYLAVMTVAISVLGIQFGAITAAHADTDADLSISAHMNFANTVAEVTICNLGPSDVTEFVIDVDVTGFEVYEGYNLAFGSEPPNGVNGDAGEFNLETMTWTGYLNYTPSIVDDDETPEDETQFNRCIYLGITGHTTGDIGEPATFTASIVSSVLSDTSVNVDPDDSNDTATVTPFEAALDPHIAIDTRLKTTGEITESSLVTFEATISNVGEGVYHDGGFMLVGFIMPDGSTLDSVSDPDLSDALSLVDPINACFSPGRAEDMGMASLADYQGDIIVCMLQTSEDLAPGTSFPLEINLTAGATFAAGTAEVVGLFEGNDPATLALQIDLITGIDIFDSGNDNIVRLSYSPDALQATADRCEGQGETTTDGTGCFTITFNKKIYAASFDESDIELALDIPGTVSVTGFDQVDDYTWEVHVGGIPLGGTVTFLLDLDGLIQDYSAVVNTTQVLGINTIRYAVPTADSDSGSAAGTASAEGTLAATGMHKPDYSTPMLLIALGSLLFALARRRKIAEVVSE